MNVTRTLNFLNELSKNNNKVWFDDNRKEYEAVKADFHAFVRELIEGCSKFDSRLIGIDVKDCTYRINRDIRFSKDKSPYKTHFGAYICPGGKKSGYSGYYFHLQADIDDYLEGSLLATGNYYYEPKILDSIRSEIYDRPLDFKNALEAAKGFSLDDTDKLKQVPKGYNPNFEYGDYLKHKAYSMYMPMDKKFLMSENLAEKVIAKFKTTYQFNEILNRSIQYAMEEE